MANIIPAPGVLHPDIDEPVKIPLMTPRFFEQFVEHNLRHATRILRRELAMAYIALDYLLRGSDPPGAGTRRDDFGKGVHAHDSAIYIKAEKRWHEAG